MVSQKVLRGSGLLVFVFGLLVATAAGQIVTGTIIGAVSDESSGVLPGVTATIASPAFPAGPSTTVTDEQGRYRFVGLPPGTYTLTLSLSGFADYTEELRVTAGGTIERNVMMKVGTVAESITVSGQSPMVDTRNVAVTNTTTLEQIESLPTIRVLVTDYLQATPGVSARSPGVYNEQVNVLGSPSNATTYVHDGIIINNPGHGNSWSGNDIDAVEEVQMVTLGPSAEYAIAEGGVVNVVTKSGTNSFRFDATGYWQPDGLQSKPITLDCRCPDGQTGFQLGKMRDWSVHSGGPIIRDRLWYFGGYKGWGFTHAQPGTYLPEATIAYWNRMPEKVVAQITDTLRITQKLNLEWYGGYGGAIPTRSVLFEATTTGPAHIHSYGNEVNKTFGASTVLSARATGWWEPEYFVKPRTGDLDTPNHFDNLTGISHTGGPLSYKNRLRRDSQSARVERYFSGAAVTHTARAGVQFERGWFQRQESYPSGVRYFDFGGRPDYALFRAPAAQAAEFRTQGVWVEDQLTIKDKFTISLGLRWDRTEGISPDVPAVNSRLDDTGGTIDGLGRLFVWKNWSPRFGFNYKLTDDGRTVVRGTYGRAYRPMILNEFDLLHPGIAPTTEARFDPLTGGYTTIVSVTDQRANLGIDPNIDQPWTDTASVGIDRQLMPQVAVSASYAYKKAEDRIGWRDVGGIYGQATTVLPDGRNLTIYPLLNSARSRFFLRTNGSEFFRTYHGVVMSVTKRLSHRWQGQVSVTLSKTEGLDPENNFGAGALLGRDPNDFTNATGRSNPLDRPVMFVTHGSYDIPRIEVQISANYQNLSNLPYAPQASIVLPQGRRNINIEPPGAYRPERMSLLFLRFNKMIRLGQNRRIEVIANIVNALQNKSPSEQFFTFNFFSPQFAQPSRFPQPRQLYVGARAFF